MVYITTPGTSSLFTFPLQSWASQVALVVKNLLAKAGNVRDPALIPGSGKSPGGGNGNLLQYSCLKNPIDREAWQARVQGRRV